jgi:shikimate dehydrogenase
MSERYGLIGKNIQYSKSPKIHEYMAKRLGIPMKYDLFDVEEEELPRLVKQLRQGVFQGFNVTIPYKQTIMKSVDVLTPKAQRIKAVNTLYVKNGQVVGDNTDYDGILGLIARHKIDVKGKKVYLLGTGGAAKAAYVVLSDLGAHITVVSRQIVDQDPMFQHMITYAMINPQDVDLYVNATPIGTSPKVNESLLSKTMVHHHTVIDLVYNPPVTELMKQAKVAYNGMLMLIIQAIKSEEIWFERKIDITDRLIDELKDVIYT